MKKKVLILIISLLVITINLGINNYTSASSDTLNVKASSTSIESGKSYTVTVSYSGSTTLGSIDFDMQYSNATCTLNSQNSNGVCNGSSGSDYHCSFFATGGFTSGTEFLNLSCTNNGTSATYKLNKNSIDAYDITGLEEVSVSGSSTTVTAYTTKSTTTTTTTTKVKTTTQASATTTTTTTQAEVIQTTMPVTTTQVEKQNFQEEIIETTTTNIQDTTESTTTTKTTTTSMKIIQEDLKLSELKIVGYDIDFKQNQTSYTINVANNVTELYIVASTVKENSKVENTGIISIDGLDEVIVTVISEEGNELEYIIKINREQTIDMSEFYLIIIITLLSAIILVVIINIIKTIKKNKKEESISEVSNDELVTLNVDVLKPNEDVITNTTLSQNDVNNTLVDLSDDIETLDTLDKPTSNNVQEVNNTNNI